MLHPVLDPVSISRQSLQLLICFHCKRQRKARSLEFSANEAGKLIYTSCYSEIGTEQVRGMPNSNHNLMADQRVRPLVRRTWFCTEPTRSLGTKVPCHDKRERRRVRGYLRAFPNPGY